MQNRISFGKKLASGVNYFITSDLHHDHKNIFKFCPMSRPWAGIEDMEQGLIDHWNSVVDADDVVFHLGDFSFCKDFEKLQKFLLELNGHIIFVLGNHDHIIRNRLKCEKYEYLEVVYGEHNIIMSHYPIYEWNRCHYGSLHFYGHQHGRNNPDLGRSMDVGIDKHLRILPLQEAVDMIKSNEIHSYH